MNKSISQRDPWALFTSSWALYCAGLQEHHCSDNAADELISQARFDQFDLDTSVDFVYFRKWYWGLMGVYLDIVVGLLFVQI